jgi:hypothetical protein
MRRLFSAIVFSALVAFPVAAFAQSDNPYITDGRITESPFNFDFEITSVTSEVDKYNKPLLILQADIDHDTLVNRLKDAYRSRAVVSDHFIVQGYAWQTQEGEWSFQLKDQRENLSLRIAVLKANAGAVIRIYGRRRGAVSARYRRVWAGFSPVNLEKYSVGFQAY